MDTKLGKVEVKDAPEDAYHDVVAMDFAPSEQTIRQRRAFFACAAISALQLLRTANRTTTREAIHPGGQYEVQRIVNGILDGSPVQFQQLFRLEKPVFLALVSWLKRHTGLRDGRYLSANLKVMIVLWIFAHNEDQRSASHRFQVSQSTVSRVVKRLLPRLVYLHTQFVRANEDDWLDPKIELDPKLNAFNGCIGAVDGTHIMAFVPAKKQLRWRDRKSQISQNVFAAVRSDFSFAYVLAGAEGSTHDATLCDYAFAGGFTIPRNRYYLADAGFGLREGLSVPFPNVRYHLEDWRNATNPPETAKELYNLRHARIRVVVEQAFGLLKRRWKIIRATAPEYSLETQTKIVYAVTGLHNFIIAHQEKRVLTPAEQSVMQAAKARADRVIRNSSPKKIRWLAAVLSWRGYKEYIAKRANLSRR